MPEAVVDEKKDDLQDDSRSNPLVRFIQDSKLLPFIIAALGIGVYVKQDYDHDRIAVTELSLKSTSDEAKFTVRSRDGREIDLRHIKPEERLQFLKDNADSKGYTHMTINGCPIPIYRGQIEDIQPLANLHLTTREVITGAEALGRLCKLEPHQIESLKVKLTKSITSWTPNSDSPYNNVTASGAVVLSPNKMDLQKA